MPKNRRAWLRLLAAAPGLAACNTIYRFDAEQPATAPFRPALYRLNGHQGHRGSGWLFGTVHHGLSEPTELPAPVLRRFSAANALAVELDLARRRGELHDSFARRAALPAGHSLDTLLAPSTVTWLRRRFTISDRRWRSLRWLQPWALTRVLHGSDWPNGQQPGSSIESQLLKQARRRTLAIHELDTVAAQVDALAGGTVRWQAALLDKRVTSPQFWDNNLPALMAAWRDGDEKRLLSVKRATFGADSLAQPLRDRMFAQRDQAMASRIDALLSRPGKLFVVVGAFHLVGANSLPVYLTRLGLSVQRIVYHRA